MKPISENALSGQPLTPLPSTALVKTGLWAGGIAVVIVGSLGLVHDVRPGCEPTVGQVLCAPEPVLMPDTPAHSLHAPPLQEHLVAHAAFTSTVTPLVIVPGRR